MVSPLTDGPPVQTWVAMLRGVNVSGHNRISMTDLRAMFLTLPAENVRTYAQSGNVVFNSSFESPLELVEAIEDGISTVLGLSVKALLRTKEELEQVILGNPFLGDGRDRATLHVTFSAEVPRLDRVLALSATRFAPDEFRVLGREIYLRCPNGYGRTKLNNAFLEKKLGVVATTRNWKTVTALAELADG